ncbi:MAG: hypothetical protein L6R36_009480 [Xanthoria steineri]|nr:MAG: hypothetical protein L6R36_009480 [Xanthoria steineri]
MGPPGSIWVKFGVIMYVAQLWVVEGNFWARAGSGADAATEASADRTVDKPDRTEDARRRAWTDGPGPLGLDGAYDPVRDGASDALARRAGMRPDRPTGRRTRRPVCRDSGDKQVRLDGASSSGRSPEEGGGTRRPSGRPVFRTRHPTATDRTENAPAAPVRIQRVQPPPPSTPGTDKITGPVGGSGARPPDSPPPVQRPAPASTDRTADATRGPSRTPPPAPRRARAPGAGPSTGRVEKKIGATDRG